MELNYRKTLPILLLAFLALAPGSLQIEPNSWRRLLNQSQQALLVTTPGWNSVSGTLRRFEKTAGVWKQIGETIPIVVGKNGLAWDLALAQVTEPTKKEGDGRSPAGIFPIGREFGFDLSNASHGLGYLPLTDRTECVDDVKSRHYNSLVNRNEVPAPDWDSSEKMREVPGYKYGAVVDYNSKPIKGAGSCIFLHIWSGPEHGTAGCTAMEESSLRLVLESLDRRKHPILVQLPEPVFKSLRQRWRLP